MSAIILAAIAFNALFPKIFTAKLRYAVWLVVLIGLLIPFRPAVGSGVVAVPLPTAAQTQTDVTESLPSPAILPDADAIQDTGRAESIIRDNTISPIMICVLVWGIVAALMFAYQIWRYLRFIRMVRRWGAQVEDESVLSVFKSVKTENGLTGKKIELRICGFVSSSMLTGFIRPVILLPEKHLDNDELELIFKHELTHYKHHDLFVKLLAVIAVSIHWFNPFVYLMCSAMQADGESTCDEAVLRDTNIENRQFYAEAIISMIGSKNTARTMLSTCFYGGKSSIKKRLDYIMDTTGKIKKPAVAVLVAVMALTLLSGSVFALTQDTPDAGALLEASQPAKLTAEQAKSVAIATVGGGTVSSCVNEFKDNEEIYRIEVIYGTKKYSMDIDPVKSTVMNYHVADFEQSAVSSNTQSSTAAPEVSEPGKITEEQAKDIAIATVGGGTVASCVNGLKENREVYKIEVIYSDKKYSMDIDAISSDVMNYQVKEIGQTASAAPSDNQASTGVPAQSNSTVSPDSQKTPVAPSSSAAAEITAEQAKSIALGVTGGGTVTECKADYENGRKVYEIKIISGNTKYEMDVDAISGAVTDYSAERTNTATVKHEDYDDDHDHDDD